MPIHQFAREKARFKQFMIEGKNKNASLAFVLENIFISDEFSKILAKLESYNLSELELDENSWNILANQSAVNHMFK